MSIANNLSQETLGKLKAITGIKDYSEIKPREHQIYAEDALRLQPIDLFTDYTEQGYKLLSRADIMLIHMLYDKGLEGFIEDYKGHVKELVEKNNYKVVFKPHYFLKNKIG